ncbi:MAG: PQQ-binding-like beta-propeller repeat protein, partial [Planctomycetaceae bacterium]
MPLAGKPEVPTEPVPEQASKARRGLEDPTAPLDKKGAGWLLKARQLSASGDWTGAFELLQKINELPEDSLLGSDSGNLWTSLRSAADQLRGEAPAELLDQYRVQFGGLAQQLLSEAKATGRPADLGRVASGYFHTEAGYLAADLLATWHLERGEFSQAGRWFEALWQARAPVSRQLAWRMKGAFALKHAGRTERATELAAGLSSRDLTLGGQKGVPDNWLDLLVAPSPQESPTQTDWPMFYGNARHSGRLQGGEPLLLARWQQPLTDSLTVREQLRQLQEDMTEMQVSALPAIEPIVVGDLIACRTLQGIQVFRLHTGERLWGTPEQQPIGRLLSGQVSPAPDVGMGMFGFRGQFNGNFNFGYSPGQGEGSPVSNLLFRNKNFGLVSSDGLRLYVLEDPQYLTNRQPAQGFFNGNDEAFGPFGTRLSAYDLRTGRPLWELGGPASGEDFELPLAGHQFFGPPVVDGLQMYLVGEAAEGDLSGQIRLFCLDSATGAVQWSQLVAYADAGIEKDLGRRWLTAQPTVANGIILCPTTVGWLVAVDQSTHSVVWGYRAVPPQPGQRAQGPDGNELGRVVPQYGLSSVWQAAPPLVADGRVLYTVTDPQVQTMVCLDLATGRELWSRPRETAIYVAGSVAGKVLVVDRGKTIARSLGTGDPVWTCEHGLPSGRGVLTDGLFHLPLSGGEIVSMDLETGELRGQTFLPESAAGGVGNLLMAGGLVLSTDLYNLSAFDQKQAVIDEIARDRAKDSTDPLMLLKQADLSILQRAYGPAREFLRQVDSGRLPENRREDFHRNSLEVLVALLRGDLAGGEAPKLLTELQALVSGPEETLLLRQLQADHSLAVGAYQQAFEAYLKLANESAETFVRQVGPNTVQVRVDLYVAGKLLDLLQVVPADQKATVEARIDSLAREALLADPETRRRFLELFPDSPQAIPVRFQRAEDCLLAGNWLGAERQWLKLLSQSKPEVAVQAGEQLVRSLVKLGQPADALAWAVRLSRRFGGQTLPDGRSVDQVVQTLRELVIAPESAQQPGEAPSRFRLAWGAPGVRVERMGANYQNWVLQEVPQLTDAEPFFAVNRLEIDPEQGRLEMLNSASGKSEWMVPLRISATGNDGNLPLGRVTGHRVLLYQGGVVHCLSPLERKLTWSFPVEGRGNGGVYYGRQQTGLVTPLRALSSGGPRFNSNGQSYGSLALISDEVICVLSRRILTVLDAETGQVRWTMKGGRSGTTVAGGDRLLYLSSVDAQQQQQLMIMRGLGVPLPGVARKTEASTTALRVLDGRGVEVPRVRELQARALAMVGDDLVLASNTPEGVQVRRFSPEAQVDLWTRNFAKGALGAGYSPARLTVLEPSTKENPEHRLSLLDLKDGSVQPLAKLPAEEIKSKSEVLLLGDPDQAYLVVNRAGQGSNAYNEQLPFQRVNGTITAIDLKTGEIRWKQSLTNQNLLLERFDFNPLLLFVDRKFQNQGQVNFWSMHFVAIDKQTGTKLLDEKSAQQPGFRSLTVTPDGRSIELRGWNDRTRLYPSDQAAASPAQKVE